MITHARNIADAGWFLPGFALACVCASLPNQQAMPINRTEKGEGSFAVGDGT
jgi:hypothetical protein